LGEISNPNWQLQLLKMDGYSMSKTSHNLSHLTRQELEALDRELLAEQVRRTLNNPDVVIVEPDAPEAAHEQALQTVLQRKGIEL
jgi:hypothetical protein